MCMTSLISIGTRYVLARQNLNIGRSNCKILWHTTRSCLCQERKSSNRKVFGNLMNCQIHGKNEVLPHLLQEPIQIPPTNTTMPTTLTTRTSNIIQPPDDHRQQESHPGPIKDRNLRCDVTTQQPTVRFAQTTCKFNKLDFCFISFCLLRFAIHFKCTTEERNIKTF